MCRIHYHNLIEIALIIVLTSCASSPFTQQSTTTQQSTRTRVPQVTLTTQQSVPTRQSTPAIQVTLTSHGTSSSKLQHIFYIMLENHATNQILGNTADAPFLNQLANTYGVASYYYGVTHPSLPNYLAAISGDFQGIWDDCPAGTTITSAPQEFASLLTKDQIASASNRPHMFNGQTLVDQLEAHNLSWKAYMQSMPSTGFTGETYDLYAQKHNPFMYFTSIRNNPARMRRVVPLLQFDQDIQSANIPNFVWITPDVCNDMHGVSSCASYDSLISLGDNFVHTIIQKIMSSSLWKEASAIAIVWDESNAASGCCRSPIGKNGVTLGGGDVPLLVVTSKGPRHIVLNSASYNHYSLLATIEYVWNLGCLANTCSFNPSSLMTQLFV